MSRRVQRKSRRRISTLGWFGIGCGATVLIGIVALGILWGLVTGEPALPPEATAGSSSGGASSDGGGSGAAGSGGSATVPSAPPLPQQIQAVQQAARADQPVRVTMTLRETEINAMLTDSGDSQVSNLKIYLGDGSMAGTADVNYRGSSIPLTVRGRPVVADERVRMEVDEVFIGRLPAPDSVRQQVRDELERGIDRLMGSRNVRVEQVQVRPDVMTVTGWVGGR